MTDMAPPNRPQSHEAAMDTEPVLGLDAPGTSVVEPTSGTGSVSPDRDLRRMDYAYIPTFYDGASHAEHV